MVHMVALYMSRICEFFIERLCSGVWSGSFSVFPPTPSLFFFLPLFHQCDGCLEWGLMAGLQGFICQPGASWP